MRNKSDIQNELYNRLNSPAWQSLRNSLIGRELIAYGTELLYMQDSLNSAVVNSFDYKHADERALISLAHTYDLGLCFTAPSWIRLRLPRGSATDVFPPFSIRCTVGSVVYTNIGYCSGNQVMTLYQGTVKTMYYPSGYNNISFVNSANLTREEWNTIDLTIEGQIVHVHNLGQALPQSVFVFVGELNNQQQVSRVRTLSQFSPLRYGPDVYSFKEYTGFDGTLSIQDGDGVWGALLDGYDLYQVVWLQPSHVEVDVDSLRFVGNGNPFNEVVIISSSQGKDGVEFAREEFTRAIYRLYPVVSKSQIREFVSAFYYILDAEVVANANIVTVYVKPEDFADEYQFGEVASELDLRSQLGAEFIVTLGDATALTIHIEGALSDLEKTQIQSLITSSFKYEDMPFDWVPSASAIAGLIQSTMGVNVRCSFHTSITTGQITDLTVDFLPIQGSMDVVESGSIVGHDVNGKIMANTADEPVLGDKFFPKVFGKLFVEGEVALPYDDTVDYEKCLDIADGIAFPVEGLSGLPGTTTSGSWNPSNFKSGISGAYGFYFTEDPNNASNTLLMLFSNVDIDSDNYSTEKVKMYYASYPTPPATDHFEAISATIFGNYVVVVEKGVDASAGSIRLRYFPLSSFNYNNTWDTTPPASISNPLLVNAPFSTQGITFGPNTVCFIVDGVLLILDGANALAVYNLGSVDVYSSALPLEIDNADLNALAASGVIQWGYNGEILGAVGYNSNANKAQAFRIDALSVTFSKVVMSAISKLELEDTLAGTPILACTGAAAMISHEIASGDTDGYVNRFFDLKSLNAPYSLIKTGTVTQIGTVNYSTGRITMNGTNPYTLEFDSYNLVRPKGVFYMINDALPVIWSSQE